MPHINSPQMKNLFNDILSCNGEESLHKIVIENEYFKNPDNWYPYGGRDKNDRSNFGAIRTTSTNEQTGAHEYAAQLSITASNTEQTNETPIIYTVEMTDNGEEFYVTVFGL